jgi:hypothetical protein
VWASLSPSRSSPNCCSRKPAAVTGGPASGVPNAALRLAVQLGGRALCADGPGRPLQRTSQRDGALVAMRPVPRAVYQPIARRRFSPSNGLAPSSTPRRYGLARRYLTRAGVTSAMTGVSAFVRCARGPGGRCQPRGPSHPYPHPGLSTHRAAVLLPPEIPTAPAIAPASKGTGCLAQDGVEAHHSGGSVPGRAPPCGRRPRSTATGVQTCWPPARSCCPHHARYRTRRSVCFHPAPQCPVPARTKQPVGIAHRPA